jgi:hypothetical protein
MRASNLEFAWKFHIAPTFPGETVASVHLVVAVSFFFTMRLPVLQSPRIRGYVVGKSIRLTRIQPRPIGSAKSHRGLPQFIDERAVVRRQQSFAIEVLKGKWQRLHSL